MSKKQNLTPALLDIHLHCLVLDGVYLNHDGAAAKQYSKQYKGKSLPMM